MSARTTAIGDPRKVAAQRAGSRRRHPAQRRNGLALASPTPPPVAYYVIAVVSVVLSLLGLVMVLSATSVSEFHSGSSPWRVFERQAWWAGFGVVAGIIAAQTPLHRLRPFVGALLIVAFGLMVLPLIPGVGVTVNDARAWVAVGQLTFQPSEFLKLAIIMQCAHILAARHGESATLARRFGPVAVFGVLGAGLCLWQGDLGSGIVIMAIVFAVVFIAGAPLLPLIGAGCLAASAGVVAVVTDSDRAARFTAFLDLAGTKEKEGYQGWQARISIAQGGLTGSGVGRGQNKLGEWLPLAHSDFIFAVVAEELGLLGIAIVLGGFLALLYAAIQVALATQDRFHSMLAAGIGSWLAVQAAINIGGVTGLIPVTGLTLPFFSAGGSSLLVTLASVGVLLNVARNVR